MVFWAASLFCEECKQDLGLYHLLPGLLKENILYSAAKMFPCQIQKQK